jgi:hypothetical protein
MPPRRGVQRLPTGDGSNLLLMTLGVGDADHVKRKGKKASRDKESPDQESTEEKAETK